MAGVYRLAALIAAPKNRSRVVVQPTLPPDEEPVMKPTQQGETDQVTNKARPTFGIK
jgi:hypothetical protein